MKSIQEIVANRLCIGCGACKYICPSQSIELYDFPFEGIRPVKLEGECGDCKRCVEVCPAIETDFSTSELAPVDLDNEVFSPEHSEQWGSILEIWEGYASDSEIRYNGASGGVLTAIGAYCLERKGMSGVLHTGEDPKDPIRNMTRLSRTRRELMAAAGSRYAPASVCDGLELVQNSLSPCAVIGKPGEIAALSKAQAINPALKSKVGLMLSFFCAETPSTEGTIALLDALQVRKDSVAHLRYRGKGWPGYFQPVLKDGSEPDRGVIYQESWKFLQGFRPWSTHIWPDGAGELADITCGDPWYKEPDGKDPGCSLVVVRTKRGKDILREAMADGYLVLQPAESWKLAMSQPGLARKKSAVWGRLLAMRLMMMPVPKFKGANLFSTWLELDAMEKLKSIFGTIRRIISKKLYRRFSANTENAKSVGSP